VIIINLQRRWNDDHGYEHRADYEWKPPESLKIGNVQYTYRASVVHQGTQYGGHYVSCVRRGDKLHMIDDAYVMENDDTMISFRKERYCFILLTQEEILREIMGRMDFLKE